MKEPAKLIHMAVEDNRCFFHVLGDKHQYYDLESLTRAHSDLKEYCDFHHIELEMEMLRQRELLGFSQKI